MADGFIVRRGGKVSEQALAPTITETETTESSFKFTIKNEDTETATIVYRIDDLTAEGESISLAGGATSAEIEITGLDDDTTFTVFATANVTGKVKSNVTQLAIKTDEIPFSPADLSPQLWLDAADSSTITQSGGKVSQWNNKGSLGNFTQSSSGSQPTTNASTLNGLNVIDFNSDFLVGANRNEWKFMHDGTVYEVFSVIKFGTTADPNARYIFMANNEMGSNNVGFYIRYQDVTASSENDQIRSIITRGGGAGPVDATTANGYFAANTFAIMSNYFDPSNGTAADRYEIRRNGGSLSATNANTSTVSTANPSFDLEIGRAQSFLPLVGSIAEIIIISGANVTSQNRTDIINYLSTKWGITI
jgi:hypothetical protein